MACIVLIVVAALFVLLGLLCLSAYRQTDVVTEERYARFRLRLICFAIAAAAFTIWRIAWQVGIPRKIPPGFEAELVAYIVFWFLAPPIWFFFEYLAFDKKWVQLKDATTHATRLKEVKDYSDFASKIWAAVVAILLMMVAMKV